MNKLNQKNGLSGLIRARNEAKFIGLCIDSCIDALDELIVVYNDCSDRTEDILEEKMKQYPGKLKIFPLIIIYYHIILAKKNLNMLYPFQKIL